jgi:aspartyl-tRNA(Asn)/glutamyl-tRNA(Gln) amidotransferase subunit A
MRAQSTAHPIIFSADRNRRDENKRFDRLFEETDLILTPTIAALAWPIGKTHPTEIDGQDVGPRGHAVFTAVANALGLPSINIPSPPAADGSRIGVQLMGPVGSDRLLLTVARQYEESTAALPWPSFGGPPAET